jgi:hypothetical protein
MSHVDYVARSEEEAAEERAAIQSEPEPNEEPP